MSRRKRPKLRLCLVFAHGKILLPFSGWEPRGTVPKLGSFLDPFCQLRGMVFFGHLPRQFRDYGCVWKSVIQLYDFTSSTAQGGGGSFKNRKPIGKVGCCESGMAERIHWWIERWLMSPLFLSLSLTIYLPIYLSSMYLSIYLSIYLSPSLFFICLSVYLSSLPVYLSICGM